MIYIYIYIKCVALRMADDLEKAAKKGKQREVWQKIYVISGKKEEAVSGCER